MYEDEYFKDKCCHFLGINQLLCGCEDSARTWRGLGSSEPRAMPWPSGQHLAVRFNQESRSPDEFVVMRQVRGEAGKSIHRSGSGLVSVARVRHSRLVHQGGSSLRLS